MGFIHRKYANKSPGFPNFFLEFAMHIVRDFSKETLGRHIKTGEDLVPLLPGVPSIYSRDKVGG